MGLVSTFASLGGGGVGSGVVDLLLNTNPFDRGLAGSQAKLQSSVGLMGGSFSKLGTFAAAGTAGVIAGVGLMAAKTVTAASDQEEALNKVNVVFEGSAGTVENFANSAAKSFGISKAAALEAAGGFGSMLQTAGLAVDESAKMSVSLVGLAGDLASFNNVDPTEALEKLRAGLAGEAEPLRTMGVFLSEARVQQEAYASGIAKTGDELTEAQKVQARYNLILEDTTKAQGDFGRTSDSLANMQRSLKAEITDLAAEIGQQLLPVAVGLLGFLRDIVQLADPVFQAIGDISKGFNDMGQAILFQQAPWDAQVTNAYALRTALAEGNITVEEARKLYERLGDTGMISAEEMYMLNLAIVNGAHDLNVASVAAGEFQGNLGHVNPALHETAAEARAAGRGVRAFAGMSAEALEEFKDDVRGSMNYVRARFEDLEATSRTTARGILRQMQKAARDQREFADNAATFLGRVQRNFGPDMEQAAEQMVASMATAGEEGARKMDVLASGNTRVIGGVLSTWERGETRANRFADEIDVIAEAVLKVPTHRTIQLDLVVRATGSGATASDVNIANALANELAHGG